MEIFFFLINNCFRLLQLTILQIFETFVKFAKVA